MNDQEKLGLCKRVFSCFSTVFVCFERRTDEVKGGDNEYVHSNLSDQTSSEVSNSVVDGGKAFIFTMADLNEATRNFSSSCKIGQGRFDIVYRGKLRDGTEVAIKRARKDVFEARLRAQFHSEVNTLASIEHLNLVKLIGYLEQANERILVEEYVPNGNLRQHLDCEFGIILDMLTRLDIAIDVAHALTYLHLYADRPIIHRDVKASNILLTDNFRAKVADFGLSRVGSMDSSKTYVSTQVKGTAGYLDPEYLRTFRLTQKTDVYAFGILLTELLTGRRPIQQTGVMEERITIRWAYNKFLKGEMIDIMDPRIERTETACFIMVKVSTLAFECAAPVRHDRPTMKDASEVLWTIRKDCQASIHE